MYIVKDIMNIMEENAPTALAENFDTVGLQVGDQNLKVTGILVALDLRDNTIDEAIEKNCNLIITHHPLFLGGIKKIDFNTPIGSKIERLIKNGISLFVSHTNFDICNIGTNDVLFDKLNLFSKEPLKVENNLGRVGILKAEKSFFEYVNEVKEILKVESIRVVGDEKKKVSKVSICTGSGNDTELMDCAKSKGCDVYITGDLTYHKMQYAQDIGLALIDGTHYYTEVIGLESIVKILQNRIDNVNILLSKSENIFKIY